MPVPLEICVDTLEDARIAAARGADRIELCSALSEGGLTPSFGLMQEAALLPVPVYAMIRPRSGGFVYSETDKSVMVQDVAAAKAAGLDGIVIGAVDPSGRLDHRFLSAILSSTFLPATLHRAFDTLPDFQTGVEDAVRLGFERILTSGQALKAEDGLSTLAETVRLARGRLSIMAGSGITSKTAQKILKATGVDELHASCAGPAAPVPEGGAARRLGFASPEGRKSLSEEALCALHAVLNQTDTIG